MLIKNVKLLTAALLIGLVVSITGFFPVPLQASITDVAQKPPMGWNSYDCFGWSVTEQEVKNNADYMATNLKSCGWEYIVVDFCWSFPGNGTQSNPNQGTGFTPRLNMDSYGRLLPAEDRFPSAAGGNGFKPLADYVHGKGLKFGIHIMRGIPRQAVSDNTPILGTSYRASNVANTGSTCSWLNHMYGLDMSKAGAQEYLNSLFQLYATWGVDFVKVDDLSSPYYTAEIVGYRNAIDNSGRNMVFSTSPGETSIAQASHIKANANMWRIKGDFWDNWTDIYNMFPLAESWASHIGPCHWPDCDMLPLGKLSKRGPVGSERYSNFTQDEKYTLMTLWSICRSPLILGGNLPENDPPTLALITNADMIAVNQNSDTNRVVTTGNYPVWCANVPGTNDRYFATFNRTDTGPANVTVTLSNLGITGVCGIKDLWTGSNLGQFSTSFTAAVNAHGGRLFRAYTNGTPVPTSTPAPTSTPTPTPVAGAVKLSGTTFGTSPAYAAGCEYDKAFDGNTSTYFDYAYANGGYTGIDLGAGNGRRVTSIKYYPRASWAGRMVMGKFQGSNTSSSSGYVDLYTISTTPPYAWTQVNISDTNTYRYLRYLGPDGSYGNVAEIEFYGIATGPTATPTPTPTTGPTATPNTFSDNFNDGNANGWTVYGGTWTVSGNTYTVTSGAGYKSMADSTSFSNLTYDADVKLTTTASNANSGILFRISSPGVGSDVYQGYYAGFGGSTLYFGRANGSAWTELKTATISASANTWYHLKVVVGGSNTKVYFNNSATANIDWNDSTYTSGAIGVRTWNTGAAFDNISVVGQ
jgi:alpha-galactosidase